MPQQSVARPLIACEQTFRGAVVKRIFLNVASFRLLRPLLRTHKGLPSTFCAPPSPSLVTLPTTPRTPHTFRNMATLGVGKKHKVTVVGSGNWYVCFWRPSASWHRSQGGSTRPACRGGASRLSCEDTAAAGMALTWIQGYDHVEAGRRKCQRTPAPIRAGGADVGV